MTEEREPTLARKRRVEDIFDRALDVAPEARAAFLERACVGDEALRRDVEELLEVARGQTSRLLPPAELTPVSAPADLHPSLRGLPLAPGMQVGDRYELLRPLGQGGMGTVFLAQDKRLRRRVAIKFLHAATREMTPRFLVEARTTARCRHENIIVIHDVDEVDGRPYMVLECLEGEPLRRRLAGVVSSDTTAAATPAAPRCGAAPPVLPVAEVLELIIPVVRALVCAHGNGIVHRDLKPENVFLCKSGIVKVLDFGIAKVLTDAQRLGTTASPATAASTMVAEECVVTEDGAVLGTLPYMSPEQWGSGEIDERTDIWAVGIMLYEMLAGRHPLAPLSYGRLMQLVPDLDTSMPAIGDAVTGLGALAELVDGCLRKRPAERIASAQELLDALVLAHGLLKDSRPRRASAPPRMGGESLAHPAPGVTPPPDPLALKFEDDIGSKGTELLVDAAAHDATSSKIGIAQLAIASGAPHALAVWRPCYVHTLQRARHFVGRTELLDALHRWHVEAAPRTRVMALVGIGGAGKSAVIERFLSKHVTPPGAPHGGGIFVWSFFENPRTEEFLAEAATYFRAPRGTAVASTVEALERALADGPPHLLVMDGLETVQSEGTAARAFGELEDPVLRRLLTALARGLGRSRLLVSSRFELSDLAAWEGEGLATVRVEPLDESAGITLLRRWGVRGNGEMLSRLYRQSGGHALALSMTGSYIGTFLEGDIGRMDDLSLREAARDDGLARRLHDVLTAYAEALAPRARDLLARLAVMMEGADLDALVALADRGGALAGHLAGSNRSALQRELMRLRRLGLVFSPRPGVYSTHPFLRQHFREYLGTDATELREATRVPLALDARPWPPPRDTSLLDTYEAMAEHALQTGRAHDAFVLYTRSMGGFGHLGLHLGDVIRGARVVRAFARGGDPAAMPAGLPAGARTQLTHEWGLYSAALGDLAFARRCYEVCIEQARAREELVSLTAVLRTLAYTERLAGALLEARGHVLASVEVARELERAGYGTAQLARGQALLGAICHELGEVEAASRHFAELAELGDRPRARRALWWAEHLLDLGLDGEANAMIVANLHVCQTLGWGGHAAQCHVLLGHVAVVRGACVDARRHLDEARMWGQTTGEVEMQLRCHALSARLALAESRHADAMQEAMDGSHLAHTAGAGAFTERLTLLAAEAALAGGQVARALDFVRPVLASESIWHHANARYLAGVACQAFGDRMMAREYLAEAVCLRARLGHPGLEEARRALMAC